MNGDRPLGLSRNDRQGVEAENSDEDVQSAHGFTDVAFLDAYPGDGTSFRLPMPKV
jgi:hypothetical protein